MLKVKYSKANSIEEKFDEFYSKALKEVQETPEYQQNAMQINCITRVLINNADVPEKLISWLINAVINNTTLEYRTANQKIFQYFKKT